MGVRLPSAETILSEAIEIASADQRAAYLDRACGEDARLRRQVEIAGVFVNQSLDEVERLADTVGLSLIQLHGDEGPVFCGEAARRTGALQRPLRPATPRSVTRWHR